ncbi:PREDICTED: cytochrome c oxidase subunit 6b-1-like [Nelumbo nucifera]|uniref:Cytochrome c oxidase subunit 6b-1-like n=1 Tax=Nelumbo nucifera TaxID=4432 RepID=A0A1U8AVT0_NELNU|nr:PREDICTED: cytochrome c oxidase subunit 6b-1-like [Nelumbo nucifera]
MTEVQSENTSSLAVQYMLQEKVEQSNQSQIPVEATEDEKLTGTAVMEAVDDIIKETAAAKESNETANQEESGDPEVEQTPEIKLETAPADFRFPTTNQTRHCFTRYIEYHRCTAAKGEGAPECDKFAKYYRSLCPGEWIDRWNEQRENGTFPGPL